MSKVQTLALQIVKTSEQLEAALKVDQKNKVRIGKALPRAKRLRTTAQTLLSKYQQATGGKAKAPAKKRKAA
jgi:hypothetical protein